MLITFILFLAINIQLSKTECSARKWLALIAFCVYMAVALMDLYWLETIAEMSFHPSDPTGYYMESKDRTFGEILLLDSSNTFYYVINWCYNHVYYNTTIISFLLKINNILLCILCYLLITKKIPRISGLDFILLFSPYLMMTMVRNVRDIYILLFVCMILLGIGVFRNNHLGRFWTWIAILLLLITRSFLLVPLFFVYLLKNRESIPRWLQYTFVVLALGVVVVCFKNIVYIGANQMLSSMLYGEEDIEELRPLLDGEFNVPVFIFAAKRILVGLFSFLFTPHPVSFISNWRQSMDLEGGVGIYTGFDNWLISLGSIFNYLFVLPLLVAWVFNYKRTNRYLLIFIVCYILLYVISYLGVTDIRIRNTVFYLVVLAFITDEKRILVRPLHYVIVAVVFIGLLFIGYD